MAFAIDRGEEVRVRSLSAASFCTRLRPVLRAPPAPPRGRAPRAPAPPSGRESRRKARSGA
eukprot:8119014-Alexandrium_andersonii.AAC.1